jgi:sigma-B regulation protein RsbU (phosphoserine phosphatase)
MPKTKLTDTAYDSAVEIAPGIFWVGFYDAPSGLHCNPYLIVDEDEAVVINTGILLASSAGHPPPIILRQDGTLVPLTKGGRPIGTIDLRLSADEPIVYEEKREQIGKEDKLLFYTDGVYEYQDDQGEFYGTERFHQLLIELKDQPVSELIEAAFESLLAFGNNTAPKDDISLLGIQLKNSLAGS